MGAWAALRCADGCASYVCDAPLPRIRPARIRLMAQPSFEQLLVQNLPLVERLSGAMARRSGLGADEAADFTSWIKLRLVENDYEILRKFRGESALSTYLTVVVSMLARDYRAQHWGRWRPSAEARRRGILAVRLETLVHRDGYSLPQAAEVLRTRGETTGTDRELAVLLSRLPRREPLRPIVVNDAPLAGVQAREGADVLLDIGTSAEEFRRAEALLESALSELPVEDRVVLRMRFFDGLSIADIARGLGIEQRPLYRRVERLLSDLRRALVARGVDELFVRDLLAEREAV